MEENKENIVENILNEEEYVINISDDVVTTIAGIAVADIPGVAEMAGGFAGGIQEVLSGKKNFSKGIKADIDGNVCIEVARGEVLVISYVGYKSVEITYTGPESIRPIVLEEDDEVLDEVI